MVKLLGYFVANNKPVIYIYYVASMVIPWKVDNYKLKSKLAYAVVCKCGL